QQPLLQRVALAPLDAPVAVLAAPLVDTLIGDEPVEPGEEAGALLEAVERGVGLHERLLHRVARGLVVAQDAQREPVGAPLVALDQETERLVVAAARPAHALGVVRDPSARRRPPRSALWTAVNRIISPEAPWNRKLGRSRTSNDSISPRGRSRPR